MADSDDFGPMESADDIAVLKSRVEELEDSERKLLKLKEENEADFGQKRARFRELFMQKEAELKADKDRVTKLEQELKETKSELEDIKTAVAVSEANKEEEIAKVRRQCEQEIQTMQALLKEAAEEASSSTAAQYESERAKLKELNENYEEEIQSIRSRLSQERQLDKGKGFLSSVADIVSRGTASLNPASSDSNTEAESLEEDMRKAQQDAEILKSVVLPLEQEIESLKQKLRKQTDNVRSLEKQKLQLQEKLVSLPNELPSPTKTTSLPSLDDIKDPEEKIQQLMKYLKAEKASRTDLEMYVAVLSTQKNVLQDDNDKTRNELKEVCTILDEEKRSHNQLKETWTMANDQFLESQRLMMMDMRRMESLLSAEQQRLLAEQQKKDLEREAQQKKVKDLEELRLKQEKEQELLKNTEGAKQVEESTKKLKKKELRLSDRLFSDKSASNTSINSVGSIDSLNFDDSLAETSLKKSLSNSEINSLSEQEFLDSGLHETQSLSEVDNLTIRISPEKVINLPSLTDAQVRAITAPTPENEARKSLIASAKSKTDSISLQGKRLVSDKEWRLMQEQLRAAREKLGRPCDMCNNYEAQLQGVQDELKEERAKLRSCERESNAEKQTINSQKNYITELEEKLKDAASDTDEQIGSLVNKVKECEKYMSELRQQHNSAQVELQESLRSLSSERTEVQKELVRLQEENDSLQGKHSKHAGQLQNEDINLPNNLDDMQLLLLKYREEIIQAKVAKEHTEESLKSQIMFLKDQVVSEQQEKSTMEETLTQEINSLQERLAIQDSIKSEFDREAAVRAQAEAKLREMDKALKSQQAQAKQLIGGLKKQLEEQSNARIQLENEVHSQKVKTQSLQTELDNSEIVQRDFVKLSQSLQIQLEEIRKSETEVRWQNEEDYDDCHSCKQAFSVTKRKHHCRHCGRIFCSDCITKTVNSGPKMRPAKVCDVCHTILVADAMPYFSTEPPHTPD
ncbi:rab GTPase-binding effector protein 1-like [Ruditapes philippinarum]|uniref:rab GTPase-binding effector protein 1-like n=1 Tax=Ruditapes philippinarum TaxID=129788 RepID=UPI00295C2FD7|nr:rab GTPase-binding effector protein 1-like [Ruditapes philippinarum]